MKKIDFSELSEDETKLVRLYRYLSDGMQKYILLEMGRDLMMNYSVQKFSRFERPEDIERQIKEELSPENVEDFDERLINTYPSTWPGQHGVELDNVEGSFFVRDTMCETFEHLFGKAQYDVQAASILVDEYLRCQGEYYFPLPTEFGATEDEMIEDFTNGFISFMKEWRERVILAMERQALENK